jgi:hypothetical protein
MTQQWRVIADKSFIMTAVLTNSSAACSSGYVFAEGAQDDVDARPARHRQIGTIDLARVSLCAFLNCAPFAF